jgi:hypothetical protein
LAIAGYALFAGASVLLLPAVFGLARSAVVGRGWLASIGGLLVAVSLMARLYFSGVDLTAFELVDQIGLESATKFVLDGYVDLSYGLWRIPVSLSAGSILGCLVLAIAAYRAGVFGLGRCLLLIWWGWTFMGVLKDTHLGTVLGGVALCLTMIPLGVGVLRGGNSQQTLRSPLGDGPSRCGETAGQDTEAHTYRGCRLAGGGHPLAAGHGGPGVAVEMWTSPQGRCWRIHTGDSAEARGPGAAGWGVAEPGVDTDQVEGQRGQHVL